MNNVRWFELGTILSMTTGYNCTNDFNKVWDLVWFICDDKFINSFGLGMVKNGIKKHILSLYPELKKIKYNKGESVDDFVSLLKEKFGDYLPLVKIGDELPLEYKNDQEEVSKHR